MTGYYSDVAVYKLNNVLGVTWVKFFGGVTSDEFVDGIATPDGGFALLGKTWCITASGSAGPNNIADSGHPWWVLKGNANGDLSWVHKAGWYASPDSEYAPFGLAASCDGHYVTGYNRSVFSLDSTGISIRKENFVAGTTLWSSDTSVPFGFGDGATCFKKTSDEKFAVSANVNNTTAANSDFSLCRWQQDPNCNTCNYTCGVIAYNYLPASNGFQFTLSQSGASNISWTVEETGASLGGGAQSSILPVPGTCVERTSTILSRRPTVHLLS